MNSCSYLKESDDGHLIIGDQRLCFGHAGQGGDCRACALLQPGDDVVCLPASCNTTKQSNFQNFHHEAHQNLNFYDLRFGRCAVGGQALCILYKQETLSCLRWRYTRTSTAEINFFLHCFQKGVEGSSTVNMKQLLSVSFLFCILSCLFFAVSIFEIFPFLPMSC